jgi:hypothetical protein
MVYITNKHSYLVAWVRGLNSWIPS